MKKSIAKRILISIILTVFLTVDIVSAASITAPTINTPLVNKGKVITVTQAPELEWEKTIGESEDIYGFPPQQTTDGGYITLRIGASSMGSYTYLIKIAEDGSEQWKKELGHYLLGKSVQQTKDGGYIIVGQRDSTNSSFSIAAVCLVKTDKDGIKEWEKEFSTTTNDGFSNGCRGYSVQQTTDGGYIVIGDLIIPGVTTVYMVKTDANGNKEWEKTPWFFIDNFLNIYEHENRDYSVQQTKDGGYSAITADTSNGILLSKIGTDGSKLWQIYVDRACGNYRNAIQQTSDGGYIYTGYEYNTSSSTYVLYLVKADAAGGQQWKKTFSGTDNDYRASVQQISDGGYIIAGTSNTSSGSNDLYLVKTNASGDKQWEKTFGVSGDEKCDSVQQAKDGGYIIIGHSKSSSVRSNNLYLVKTDATGSKQWEKTFGVADDEKYYTIKQAKDGGYIIIGHTYINDNLSVYMAKIKTGSAALAVPESIDATYTTGTIEVDADDTLQAAVTPMLKVPDRKVVSSTNWTGIWDTGYGEVKFDTPMRNQVIGHYYNNVGTLTGTMSVSNSGKAVLKGTYIEGSGDDIRRGFFEFTMSDDKQSFTGFWRNEEDDPLSQTEWNGDR